MRKKLIKKYQELSLSYRNWVDKFIGDIIVLMNKALEANMTLDYEMKKLKVVLNQNESILKANKVLKKIKLLYSYSIANTGKPFSANDINLYVLRVLNDVKDVKIIGSYCFPNYFDDVFSLMVDGDPEIINKFNAFSVQIKNGVSTYVEKFINSYARKWQIQSVSDVTYIRLKAAVLRYIFDISYIIDPSVLCGSYQNIFLFNFFRKCQYISSFSPKCLGINAFLFSEYEYSMPIISLIKNNLVMNEISNNFLKLQFYICPIDILFFLSDILNKLPDFAKANEKKRVFGDFTSMIDNNQHYGDIMLSFDDCFSLYFMTLLTNPPSNIFGLSDLLQTIPEFLVNSEFNYSKTIFIAAVNHILEINEKQFCDNTISEDPLGIID